MYKYNYGQKAKSKNILPPALLINLRDSSFRIAPSVLALSRDLSIHGPFACDCHYNMANHNLFPSALSGN